MRKLPKALVYAHDVKIFTTEAENGFNYIRFGCLRKDQNGCNSYFDLETNEIIPINYIATSLKPNLFVALGEATSKFVDGKRYTTIPEGMKVRYQALLYGNILNIDSLLEIQRACNKLETRLDIDRNPVIDDYYGL